MPGIVPSLVAAACVAALCTAAAGVQEPKPAFEVASVKRQASFVPPSPPSGPAPAVSAAFYRVNATVVTLVRFAYGVTDAQVIGGPEWIRKDMFEINARAADALPQDGMRPMVASLLEDRFKLTIRREQRQMRGEVLVLARDDRRLGPTLEKCEDPAAPRSSTPIRVPAGSYPFSARCQPMGSVAAAASSVMRVPVVDRTGLEGLWSYYIHYAQPEPLPPGRLRDLADAENLLPFPAALQSELGLRLEDSTGPFVVLVIEAVQQPTEN